mgnify:CR=1 FL=1
MSYNDLQSSILHSIQSQSISELSTFDLNVFSHFINNNIIKGSPMQTENRFLGSLILEGGNQKVRRIDLYAHEHERLSVKFFHNSLYVGGREHIYFLSASTSLEDVYSNLLDYLFSSFSSQVFLAIRHGHLTEKEFFYYHPLNVEGVRNTCYCLRTLAKNISALANRIETSPETANLDVIQRITAKEFADVQKQFHIR